MVSVPVAKRKEEYVYGPIKFNDAFIITQAYPQIRVIDNISTQINALLRKNPVCFFKEIPLVFHELFLNYLYSNMLLRNWQFKSIN